TGTRNWGRLPAGGGPGGMAPSTPFRSCTHLPGTSGTGPPAPPDIPPSRSLSAVDRKAFDTKGVRRGRGAGGAGTSDAHEWGDASGAGSPNLPAAIRASPSVMLGKFTDRGNVGLPYSDFVDHRCDSNEIHRG